MWQKKLISTCLAPKLSLRLGFAANRSFYSKTSASQYDIIIVGGGLVGSTLACALGKNTKLSDQKILLLEGSPNKKWALPEKYGNRVSTLIPGTYNLLNEIGAWRHIAETRFQPVKRMQVWDSLSGGLITFDNENDNVGYVVENDLVINSVSKELNQLKNVEILYNSKIKDCSKERDNDFVTLNLDNGKSFSCKLVIGCDGANSLVRKLMNVHYVGWNYNHMGIVATLKIEDEFENTTAWQKYMPDSEVIALLPLTTNLSSLVWSLPIERAKSMLAKSDEEFVAILAETIMKEFPKNPLVETASRFVDNFIKLLNLPSSSSFQVPPKILSVEEKSRAGFPLGFGHASNYIGDGFVLVGDAAHRIHPQVGQGVNLGFGDIVCLNKVLGDCVYDGEKLGNISYLRKYESGRQRHNIPMMASVEGLFRIFDIQFAPVVLLRGLGLQATHAHIPLKRAIVAQASV